MQELFQYYFWYSSNSPFKAPLQIVPGIPPRNFQLFYEKSHLRFLKKNQKTHPIVSARVPCGLSARDFTQRMLWIFQKFLPEIIQVYLLQIHQQFLLKIFQRFLQGLSGVPSENPPGVPCGNPSEVLTGILSGNPPQIPCRNSLLFLVSRKTLGVFKFLEESLVRILRSQSKLLQDILRISQEKSKAFLKK